MKENSCVGKTKKKKIIKIEVTDKIKQKKKWNNLEQKTKGKKGKNEQNKNENR